MWSFYHDKKHQVWLWWAVDHKTNTPLAYTFGTREYKYLDELLKLLSEFHIGMVYADNNFAYSSRISADKLVTGNKNVEIHKAVIGTFINIFFFGYAFDLSTIL